MHIKVPSRASPKPLLTFVHLILYANPTWLDKLLVCVGVISAIAAGVPFPLVGIIFGQLVDSLNTATCNNGQATVSNGELQSSINSKVLLLIYLAIATFVLIYTHIVCWSIASQRLAQRVRDRYLKSLLRQDIAFFDNLQAGEVSSRLNGDIQAIETGTSEKVGVFLTCISFCVTAYIVAFIKDAKLAGMLISLIPAFLLMAVVGGQFVSKHATKVSDYFAKASAIASEGLSNIGLVHALGANGRLEEKYREHLGKAKRHGIKKAVAAAVQAGLLYFIAFSANALAYWQGSRKIAASVEGRGGTTAGEIYTVIFILVDGAIVLSQIAPLLPLFSGAIAAFSRLRNDIDQRPTIDGTADSGMIPSIIEGRIEFRDVSFTYPARHEHVVLNNVSFHCQPGKATAIVGISGSGKSTIAALIARFYDPTKGSVFLDDFDIKSLHVRSLRSLVSIVPQEPSLLDRSILENIALGLVNSTVHKELETVLLSDALPRLAFAVRNGEDLNQCAARHGAQLVEIVHLVQKAADLADASSFISQLECGLATKVGSNGSLISGGQKQRIALARALVRDPKILILDEATAALDSASEQRIQTAIENASKGRTVISIAHRLSTIRNSSKIVVMKSGSVVEQGTHSELMNQNGDYAAMVRLQSVKHVDDSINPVVDSGDHDVDAVKGQADANISEKATDDNTAFQEGVEDGDGKIMGQHIFKSMSPLVRPYLFLVVSAFLAALVVGGTYPASGAIFGNTLGSFSPCNPPDYIRSRGLLFSGLFFMLACVEFLANFTSWSVFGLISERLINKVRIRSFRSLLLQPLQWHESHGRTPSMLLGYITNDGNALAGFSGSIIGTLFSVIVNFVAAIILSHIIAWRIAVVLLAIVPLLLGSGFMQLRAIARFSEKHADAFSSSVGITVEAVSNIRTVAALSLEGEVLQTYRRSLRAPRKEMVLQSFKSNIWLAIANSMGNILYAFAHWWGSKNILEGRYTQTQYFIILMAMLVSAQLWGQLFTLAPEISRARKAIARIVGVLELERNSAKTFSGRSSPENYAIGDEKKDLEAFADSPNTTTPSGGAAVEFREVTFSYPARPNAQVLNSISFSIRPGQFCALVGPSGAGKSTVLALLERFYSANSGCIDINGLNIARVHDLSFRDDIAYVPQDNVLFQGTVRFNIGLGARPGQIPSDEDIDEACKLANIHETIMALPKGYETQCGASGSQFSGGQRQRLAIARALVRKPKLLLLDESTSALDAESECALELGLETAIKSRGFTVIAIAHRLRTIARADVIFVIEGGKVVDQGRHDELVERSESYRVNALHQMLA